MSRIAVKKYLFTPINEVGIEDRQSRMALQIRH